MASPFPGMDPFLEAHWRDIHSALVIYSRDALQGVLPPPLRARVEERVLLESAEGFSDRSFYPDVRVIEYAGTKGERKSASQAVAEPIFVSIEELTERYIQIIDSESGNRVVTVIEFLSPSNKQPGPNQDSYLAKQRELRGSNTSLVEIDLVRAGQPVLMVHRHELLPRQRTVYMACVRRAWHKKRLEVYPIDLRQRLPAIRIPLRPKDKDVPLDLQHLIDLCYRNGGYDGTLDYQKEPDPPPSRADAEWMDDRLREKGVRKPAGRKKKRS